MPFGLCNAPATFQRCMLSIFSDMIGDILEIFMDDLSIFCFTFDTCPDNLSRVLIRCKDKNLLLNWEKCDFMVQKGIVLGHIISKVEFKWTRQRWTRSPTFLLQGISEAYDLASS